LHFLSGPRQVGKTTAIKILIHQLLEKKDPKSIFYYSCDELIDNKELGEVLDSYISTRKSWGIKKSIIFLDEITFVTDWWRAVKSRIDAGIFRSDVLILSGSATIDLLKHKELFPGRRGFGLDLILSPLDWLFEATVAAHLARAHPVFYWRGPGGRQLEVDVVCKYKDSQVGFEVTKGVKKWKVPWHIKKWYLLDRDSLPLYLSALKTM